jgi:hypothetical protein
LQKILATFFVIFSLASCRTSPPRVDTCVSDPESNGMHCNTKEDKEEFRTYSETGNYVCHPPEDYKALIEWIKRELEK